MIKSKYQVTILVCLAVAIGAFAVARYFYFVTKDYAKMSCIVSVEAIMASALSHDHLQDRISLADTWRTLSEEERILLLKTVNKNEKHDCDVESAILDGKSGMGENLRIAVRRRHAFIEVHFEELYNLP